MVGAHPALRRVTAFRLPRWSTSLSRRLFISHVAVLVLGTAVLGIGFSLLIWRSPQSQIPAVAPVPVLAEEVALLRGDGQSLDAIRQLLTRQLDGNQARIIVLDAGDQVLIDTGTGNSAMDWRPIAGAIAGSSDVMSGVTGPDGKPAWSYVAARSTSTEPATTVIVARSRNDLRSALQDVFQPLILAEIIALLAAGIVGALLAGSLARPLSGITAGLEAIAQGHEGRVLDVQRTDELGRLCTAFNRMSVAVRQSDQALRDVLMNVTHDLHTPLTSIRGWAEIIGGGELDEATARQAGAAIMEESLRMEQLIDSMLLLSRIEGGALGLRQSSCPVDELLAAARERCSAPGRCVLQLGVDVPSVRVDPEQFARVLDNLIANALRYGPGDRPVELGACALPEDGLVRLWVADEGPGIPVQERERVFERFYQIDGARRGGSAGLGLAIARGIVEAHGGTIWAEANEPSGARLVIALRTGVPSATMQRSG